MTLVDGHFDIVVDGIERVSADLLGDLLCHFLVALTKCNFEFVLYGFHPFDFQGSLDGFVPTPNALDASGQNHDTLVDLDPRTRTVADVLVIDLLLNGQLDVLIDIVSYGVAPAVLLLSVGQFDPIFLPGTFLMLAAAAIRLSYFSTFGLADGKHYTGLALDNNSLVLVFIFLLEGVLDPGLFAIVLYASGVGLAMLNVSRIKTPKLSGNPVNVYRLAAYTLAITGIYGWKLL